MPSEEAFQFLGLIQRVIVHLKGPVKLGMLQPGEYRELTPAELSAIRGYMNKAVNRRQNAEGEKAAAERGSRPAKKAPVKPAGKGRTPLGRR